MRRKTIEDLPNELLAHIFQYINNPRSKYLPVKSNRFRAIVSMTSVSRRFRTIALLFAQQDLVFNYVDELEYTSSVIIDKRGSDAELKPGEEKGGRFHWIFHTRSIRVGCAHYPSPYHNIGFEMAENEYHRHGDPYPFTRLRSFECIYAACAPCILRSLQHCPDLKTVSLAWNDETPFPKAEYLSKVETFRLYLSRKIESPATTRRETPLGTTHPTLGLPAYTCITTLALHDCADGSDIVNQCMKLSFPNLRVLRLGFIVAAVPLVYDFIQRHTTILEANVEFPVRRLTSRLRFSALMKLIHGTGTWIAPEGSTVIVDQPVLPETVTGPLVPPEWEDNYGFFYRFAFSRRPIISQHMEEQSSTGSDQPRYDCTGLAIKFLEDEEDEDPELYANIETFMDRMPASLPYLEELRVSMGTEACETGDFRSLMASLKDKLREWGTIRKFTFFQERYMPMFTWDPYPDDETDYGFDLGPGMIPFLDEPQPDVLEDYYFGSNQFKLRLTTLSDILQSPSRCDMNHDEVRAAIRRALCMDEDDPLDEDDPQLLMHAWEAHNYPRVSRLVRKIAEACPVLEEFEWYVSDRPERTVVWSWKIIRDKDGSVRQVNGTLLWQGCMCGDPPPFPVYVGQELEYTRVDSGGQYQLGATGTIYL